MSHFVKCATKLSNKELLKKALTRLGFEHQEGNFTVTEYGKSSKAELLLDKSLGLSLQEDGTYAFVGDPYHASKSNVRSLYGKLDGFSKQVATAYSIEEATENLAAQGYFCTENSEAKVSEDGMIRMVYESYSG